jgi:hypothetical protein
MAYRGRKKAGVTLEIGRFKHRRMFPPQLIEPPQPCVPAERSTLAATAEAEPLLLSCVARVVLAQRANFILLAVIHEDVAVRAKIFVLGDAWSTYIEKSHGRLLRALCPCALGCAPAA